MRKIELVFFIEYPVLLMQALRCGKCERLSRSAEMWRH